MDTALTFPKSFGFSYVCFATRSSNCVLVAVTVAGVASEAAAILTSMSVLVVFGASIETGLEIHSMSFIDYGILLKIL